MDNLLIPVSFTPLKDFETCPRRFYWTNIAKLPIDDEDLRLMFAFGAFFHDRLEKGFRAAGEVIDRRLKLGVPIAFPLDVFRRAATADAIPSEHGTKWSVQFGHVLQWVIRMQPFLSLWVSDMAPVVEEPFAFDPEWQPREWQGNRGDAPKGFRIRSFIDLWFGMRPGSPRPMLPEPLMSLVRPGTVVLIDWKTAVRRFRSVDPATGRVAPQLATYAASIFARFPWVERVLGTFFNTRFLEPEPFVVITRETAEVFGGRWVEQMQEDIASRDPANQSAWPAKDNPYCAICPFRTRCEAWQSRRHRIGTEAIQLADAEAGP